MKKTILISAVVLLSVGAFAAETNATPEQIEAKYTAAIEGRTADILKILVLSDMSDPAANKVLKFPKTFRGLKNIWCAVIVGGDPDPRIPNTATFSATPRVMGLKVKAWRFQSRQLVK